MRVHHASLQVLAAIASCWMVGAPLAGSSPRAMDELTKVLATPPHPSHGEALYATCAACHGAVGAGAGDGSVPAIAAQHFSVIVQQLLDYRHGRRWDPHMERFASQHSLSDAQDIADIAAYISRLKPAPTATAGDGTHRAYGGKVYKDHCASCHGRTAQGNDRQRYPRLAGQHYEYLLRQLHDAVEGRRPNYPREHIRLFKGFQNPEFVGLADYLSQLKPPGTGQ